AAVSAADCYEDDYDGFNYDGTYCDPDLDEAGTAAMVVGVVMAVGTSIWSQIDAPISAGKINRRLGTASLRVEPRMVALQRAPRSAASGVAPGASVRAPTVGLSMV